jgi:hypothetical protein
MVSLSICFPIDIFKKCDLIVAQSKGGTLMPMWRDVPMFSANEVSTAIFELQSSL